MSKPEMFETSMEKAQSRRFSPTIPALRSLWLDILILSAIVVVLSMMGGTPYSHPDFITGKVARTLQSGGNPNNFLYPGLTIYIDSFVYGALLSLNRLVDSSRSQVTFEGILSQKYLAEGISVFLPGLLVTVAFSVLGVIATYLVTLRLTASRILAFVSGLFLTTSALWVAHSHYLTVDIPVSALTITTVALLLTIVPDKTPLSLSRIVALGAVVGLTTSAKYTGALVVLPVVISTLVCYRDRRRWLLHMIAVAGIALLVFLLTNPFMLLTMERLRSDLYLQIKHARVGHAGYQFQPAWQYYLRETIVSAFEWPLLVMAVIGLGALFSSRRIDVAAKLAAALFPGVYFISIAGSPLTFHRYMLPIIPFVAVYAAMGLLPLYTGLQHRLEPNHRKALNALLLAFALILVVPNLRDSLNHDLLLTREDTRADFQVLASRVLNESGRRTYVGSYLEELVVRKGGVQSTWDELEDSGIDLLVLDSFSHDRFIYDSLLRDATRVSFGMEDAGFMHQLSRKHFGTGDVLVISPFRTSKDQVPFSPESVYSPYPPDLSYRVRPGPYIEIYSQDQAMLDRISDECVQLGLPCQLIPVHDGYYYRRLPYQR
jgi:hypothetical protein